MRDDEFTEADVDRKDGKLGLEFVSYGDGLMGISPRGADIEMSGCASIVLTRNDAIRLYEAIGKYIKER
jgi:hypothetical protein